MPLEAISKRKFLFQLRLNDTFHPTKNNRDGSNWSKLSLKFPKEKLSTLLCRCGSEWHVNDHRYFCFVAFRS